jgi:hypothetical protein
MSSDPATLTPGVTDPTHTAAETPPPSHANDNTTENRPSTPSGTPPANGATAQPRTNSIPPPGESQPPPGNVPNVPGAMPQPSPL